MGRGTDIERGREGVREKDNMRKRKKGGRKLRGKQGERGRELEMNTWSFGNRHTGSQGQEAGCSLSYQCRNRVLLSSTGDEAVGDFFPMGDVPWPCFTVIHHCRWIQ